MAARTPEQQIAETQRQRRRQNLREIVLPFTGGVVFVLALTVITALLPREGAANFVANLFATLFLLCPLALCMFPFALLMVSAVYGMGRLNELAYKPLRGLEGLTVNLNNSSSRLAQRIVDTTIDLSATYEKLDRAVISKLDPPADTDGGSSSHSSSHSSQRKG